MTDPMSMSTSMSYDMEEEDDCCYAISEKSFVGVGELLCEADKSDAEASKHRHEHRLKLIVAGESGVGKSSFINSLARAYTNGTPGTDPCIAGSATSRELFYESPDSMCAVFSVQHGADRITCTIQDTPGYGDGLDIRAQIEDVVEHIRQLNHAHFRSELDQVSSAGSHNQHAPDNRVDACLYFIPPHRLKEIDLVYMRLLSNVVSIIPVIAKADTMTDDELNDFKAFVLERCIARSVRLASFEEDTVQRVGWFSDGPLLPFAVVAGGKCDQSMSDDSATFWPVRKYSWGVCQAFHREHSDCYWLQRLVLEEGFFDLKRDSNLRYALFRNDQLQIQKPIHIKLWHRLLQLLEAPCSKTTRLQQEQELRDMSNQHNLLPQATGPAIHDTPALAQIHGASLHNNVAIPAV